MEAPVAIGGQTATRASLEIYVHSNSGIVHALGRPSNRFAISRRPNARRTKVNKRARRTLGTFALVALAASYGCGGDDTGGGNNLSSDGGPDATQDTGQTDDGGGDSSMMGGEDGGDATMTMDSGGDTSTGNDGSMGSDASDGGGSDAAGDAAPDATSTDGGSSDAASDAPSDAGWDGNTACSGTNTPCTYANDAGVAQNGVCQASNTCGACSADSQCAGYGNGYICVGGACVVGNCHTNTDCANNDAGAVVCVNSTCTACDPVTGGNYYVDPVNGSDGPDATGSDMAGGQTASVCAFKTITHALSIIKNPTSATTITVLHDDPSGETWPITVPANVVIKGSTPTITITVTGTTNGFVLGGASSGLESLVISGTAGNGVQAGAGSTSTTYLKNVTVTGFAGGDAVLVNGASSVLTLDEGVTLTKSLNGLHVTDTATVDSMAANQSNPVVFSANAQYGMLVDKHGAVSFTGSAGTLGAGSIIATGNTMAGGAFIPDANSPSIPASLLSGFVAWANSGPTTGGLLLEGGAHVKVRKSYFGANGVAVEVTANLSNLGSTDTSGIDLGAVGDNGLNTLQSPNNVGTDAGVSAQNGTGVCVQFTPNNSQNLLAIGNYWANGTTAIDCTKSTSALTVNNNGCAGNQDLGGQGFNPSSRLQMYVDTCTCSLNTFLCQ
jgi:hypothetical protein